MKNNITIIYKMPQQLDLSGIFHIQKDYISGINTSDPLLKSKITNIQSQLDKLSSDFKDSTASTNATLDHQQDMLNIVDTEKQRLLLKKEQIDTSIDGKKRGVLLNDSYRQRFEQYTKIIIIIIFTLAIFVLILMIGRNFPFIPSFVLDLLSIILFIVCFFSVYFTLVDIYSRDRLNYNELNLTGPSILTPAEIEKKNKEEGKAGNLLGSINIGTCVGQGCCSDGAIWDGSNNVCLSETAYLKKYGSINSLATPAQRDSEQFSTMSFGINTNFVQPNSPNEYIGYSKI
jgi:hypothetical protein